jgi:hypothetical protein
LVLSTSPRQAKKGEFSERSQAAPPRRHPPRLLDRPEPLPSDRSHPTVRSNHSANLGAPRCGAPPTSPRADGLAPPSGGEPPGPPRSPMKQTRADLRPDHLLQAGGEIDVHSHRVPPLRRASHGINKCQGSTSLWRAENPPWGRGLGRRSTSTRPKRGAVRSLRGTYESGAVRAASRNVMKPGRWPSANDKGPSYPGLHPGLVSIAPSALRTQYRTAAPL